MIRELGADKGLVKLADYCESWIEGAASNSMIKRIIAHPLSKTHRQANPKFIYRAIEIELTMDDEGFSELDIPKIVKTKARYPIVAYSESKHLAKMALLDFEPAGGVISYKKKFNKSDLILNFSSLVADLSDQGYDTGGGQERGRYRDEEELWMKPTQYYLTFKKEEKV